ncbi:hypothetical protein KGQ71_04390 [Patescibacteria group bacterium]|nr:hypothetical protein [Patescibacteria group bacterium]
MNADQVYRELQQRFGAQKKNGLWPTALADPDLQHAHVNSLIAFSLCISGHAEEGKAVIAALFASSLLHPVHLSR